MKHIYFIASLVLIFSCSKNNETIAQDNFEKTPTITYDTTAIDSFGPGATSESVMAKINAVAIKREQDSLAKIAKAEQEKLDKEKAEKEAQNIKEEKERTKTEQPSSTENLQTNP